MHNLVKIYKNVVNYTQLIFKGPNINPIFIRNKSFFCGYKIIKICYFFFTRFGLFLLAKICCIDV